MTGVKQEGSLLSTWNKHTYTHIHVKVSWKTIGSTWAFLNSLKHNLVLQYKQISLLKNKNKKQNKKKRIEEYLLWSTSHGWGISYSWLAYGLTL